MEAQTRTSKKRCSNDPFSGIITRHKSQKFFFHHNRSGKSRRSCNFPDFLTNSKLPINQRTSNLDENVVHDDNSHVSIKDLRARRVFSKPIELEDEIGKSVNPNSSSDLIVENPSLSVPEKCDLVEDSNGGNPNLSVLGKSGVKFKGECLIRGNPNLSDLGKSGVDSKGDCLIGGNPNLSIEDFGAKSDMSPNLSRKDLKGKNGWEDVETTPPDAVILVNQSRRADSVSPPKKISPTSSRSAEGKKNFSNYRRNLGLNPCSRPKLFKAPNSFSYKRLLPFLMDLAKDSTSAPKVRPTIKIETDDQEKPLVSSSQDIVIDCLNSDEKPLETAVVCVPQALNVDIKDEESQYLDLKTIDSNPQQATPCTPVDFSIEMSQEARVFDENQIGTPVTDDTMNGGASADRQVSLDDINPIVETDFVATLHSPKRSSEPSGEDGSLNTPSPLTLSSERECREAIIESKLEENSISVFHSSSKLDDIFSPGVSGFGLAKGILKRNPRGCRGICSCLNCASFRLNAEKAFEFSRNQWLDTEELSMELMKELSNLRCMLEKSVNKAGDNAIVPVDQIQEFCRRASDAECTARSRLMKMREDLHFHCRTEPLQRPRVNFSSSVQEKIIGGK